MLNIEQLLAPISDESPCGEDIAFSPEVDAVSKARQADDPTLEQGAWVTSLKEADWKFVAARCAQLIEKSSKDLRLAVWLAEASARTSSFQGLGDSLMLVAALCERYWHHLHPLPDEGSFEQRIGNLCWIAARLPQLVKDMPDPDAASVAHCAEAVGRLEKVVDERLGADGPGFSAARSALDSVIHSLGPSAGVAGQASDRTMAMAPATHESQLGQGPLHTRAHAIAQLRQVAEYFRRTEPHSPVAYLADKAAAWGEQPLHVWLRGVIKDESAFAHIEELLGLQRN
ncbi:type VI secretion system protein TssA [Massilia sp. GCM10020059]|uniref:Type VI secretion system protein TssA n=1 Tax=Massilia agrisoli TaxID=2892444 RepID=A0ABS8IX04_9BURK|nr:type VI secretion system protein TssA [Massilia agrisoli]MCC6072208.1 type VI secretion system protein TssA [Massilia agrisoli]